MSNREGITTIVGRWIRGLRASALSLAIGANGMALGAEPAAQTAPEAVKDVGTSRTELRPLFNGKNLDGWYLFETCPSQEAWVGRVKKGLPVGAVFLYAIGEIWAPPAATMTGKAAA